MKTIIKNLTYLACCTTAGFALGFGFEYGRAAAKKVQSKI